MDAKRFKEIKLRNDPSKHLSGSFTDMEELIKALEASWQEKEKLKAENEELVKLNVKLLDENAELKRENERLKKAAKSFLDLLEFNGLYHPNEEAWGEDIHETVRTYSLSNKEVSDGTK